MKIGNKHDVTFNVNVMGTSAEPKVRVVLSTRPELMWPATKQGDSWLAEMELPATLEPGTYDLRVEVLVGNRHFTPVTKPVTLEANGDMSVQQPSAALAIKVEEAPVESSLELTPPPNIFIDLKKPVLTVPKVVKSTPAPSLLKIAAAVTESRSARPKMKPAVVPLMEIRQGMPVELIKGEIIYE